MGSMKWPLSRLPKPGRRGQFNRRPTRAQIAFFTAREIHSSPGNSIETKIPLPAALPAALLEQAPCAASDSSCGTNAETVSLWPSGRRKNSGRAVSLLQAACRHPRHGPPPQVVGLHVRTFGLS